MDLEQLDQYCDEFERRLKDGTDISAEEFARQCGLADEVQLLSELEKLSRDYKAPLPHGQRPLIAGLNTASALTQIMPNESGEKLIGRYKLLQKIGEGGMGVVYMAEQSEPVSRRVAVKIIKPGMDSRDVLARFEAERQALALMDHPNIARILDAGMTDQGLPYFVMELVKGVPITTYCDERKLSTRDRLDLFLSVCHAVQHAHQKGVIHRDLKPSNVLVAQYDGKPVPKIIDFGLVKAFGQRLTEKTLFTQYGQIVGTIDYMSPEQASFNQLDVDTRGDIYSLGVILYELIVGETPFDRKRLHSASIDEMLRIIRQEDPPRPSVRLSSHASLPTLASNRCSDAKHLSLLVRGELDWIVMKALDKERDRRYQSANAFADDITRYLKNESVAACPPSAGYRLQKLARRNRRLFISSAAVIAALVLGLISTSYFLIQAKLANAKVISESKAKEERLRDLHRQFNHAAFQRIQYRRIEEAGTDLADALAAKLSSKPVGSDMDLRWDDLANRTIAFWDRVLAAETDMSGAPGPRAGDFRLRRALAQARFGDHERAFEDAQLLRNEMNDTAGHFLLLARIYAVCAIAVEAEQGGLAELYVSAALHSLEQAADLADIAPPSPDDPDFAVIASQPQFRAILSRWSEAYTGTAFRQSRTAKRSLSALQQPMTAAER